MNTDLSYTELQFPIYRNSKVIGTIGSIPITISDAIMANLLVGNKVFLGGKKGIGKTQLLFDVRNNWYGGKGVILQGSEKLSVDDVYKRINLEKLRSGATSSEIFELASTVDLPFIGVDELNRCPEIIQNQLLSLMNGYLLDEHTGREIILGKGHTVGIATGNLGNGEYTGTFKVEGALADRLHLFLNMDHYRPTDEDKAETDALGNVDPGVKQSATHDLTERLRTFQIDAKTDPTPWEMRIIARYMERALDHCAIQNTYDHSKDQLGPAWPSICTENSCPHAGTLCGKLKAVGERTVQAMERCGKGLLYVASLKQPDAPADTVGAMMLAARLMLPYSGSISPVHLNTTNGNTTLAAAQLANEIHNDITTQFGTTNKPGPLLIAYAYANKGRLREKEYQPPANWQFVTPQLEKLNGRNSKTR